MNRTTAVLQRVMIVKGTQDPREVFQDPESFEHVVFVDQDYRLVVERVQKLEKGSCGTA